MDNLKLATFILGWVDQSVASKLPEEEHLQLIKKDLEKISETNLYYYLVSGYKNNLLCKRKAESK